MFITPATLSRPWLVTAVVALLWTTMVAAGQSLLEAADEALAQERTTVAEQLYRKALEEHPDLLSAHMGLAEALEAQNRRDDAVALLIRVGEGLIGSGVPQRAFEVLQRALELAPTSARAQALMGRAAALERRYPQAVVHLGRAVELGAADLRTVLYLAAAHWENGRPDVAEAVYRRILAAGADSFLVQHQLGRLLAWQGRPAEAVEILRLAAKKSDGVDVELDLARALQAAGEDEEALAAFRRVVQLDPDRSHGRYGLARAMARLGDSDGAREQLEIYRRLYEREQQRVREVELAKAHLGEGWELVRRGAVGEAIAHFEAMPPTADVLVGLAAAHATAGDLAAAVAALETAVTLEPERGDLRLRLAEARLGVEE